MKPPIKLSSIDQEHLQELYDAAKVARDQLPYTDQFDALWEGFQDRTFKNADREQVYAALLKYSRSGSVPAIESAAVTLTEDQLKFLKGTVSKHAKGGKILPYSDELENARRDFNKQNGTELTAAELWRAMMKLQASRRRPPVRKKAVKVEAEDEADDGE